MIESSFKSKIIVYLSLLLSVSAFVVSVENRLKIEELSNSIKEIKTERWLESFGLKPVAGQK